jgi:hypothetical protein
MLLQQTKRNQPIEGIGIIVITIMNLPDHLRIHPLPGIARGDSRKQGKLKANPKSLSKVKMRSHEHRNGHSN